MSDNGLSPERLTWMYTQMVRIREFEERVKRTFEEHPGVIRGHTHLADGAEASIVGSLAALGPDDQLTSTYRGHGYPIALGGGWIIEPQAQLVYQTLSNGSASDGAALVRFHGRRRYTKWSRKRNQTLIARSMCIDTKRTGDVTFPDT